MSTLLQDHLKAVENTLLAQSHNVANAGHSLHKGMPREDFLKFFLVNHLSERVAIGQGEIIDARTQADEPRHQNNIIIYRRNFPRIAFDHTISGYLAESVVATVEVKSALTKDELAEAVKAAHNIKQLGRHDHNVIRTGYQPPSILSYVVAYTIPARAVPTAATQISRTVLGKDSCSSVSTSTVLTTCGRVVPICCMLTWLEHGISRCERFLPGRTG